LKITRRPLVPTVITRSGQKAHPTTSSWVVLQLCAALAITAAAGFLAFRLDSGVLDTREAGSDDTSGQPARSSSHASSLEFDNPLGPGGRKVRLHDADALLTTYRTAKLPSFGPLAPEHVTAAWIDDDDGQVGYSFDNGILIIYTPDQWTPDQFAEAAAESIARRPWERTTLRLRWVTAWARDKGESWPAVLGWVEGTALVTMYGDGGQLIPELIRVAETMRYQG
jgi:hypothetical protein